MSVGDLLAPIDNYCERLDASLFAEPLNAVTNGAFLLAAWLLYRSYRASGRKDGEALSLIALVAVVGLGSLSFHTFANHLTMLADVIPIGVFVLTYIWVGFRRLLGWGCRRTLAAMLVFLCVAPMMGAVPPALAMNGSIAYMPCLGVLLFLAARLKMRGHAQAKRLLAASGIFVLSLGLRSVDMQWCDSLPMGTHFLWHSLNGVLLYLLVASVMRNEPSINK
jgi:hypothetical protein